MASEVLGDGFEIPIRGEFDVGFDVAKLRGLTKEMRRSGADMGQQLAKQFVAQMGPINKGLKDALEGTETRAAADHIIETFTASIRKGFEQFANMADAAFDETRKSGTVAAETVGEAFSQAGREATRGEGGMSKFNAELKETLRLGDGMESRFEAVFKAIAADLAVMRSEFSKGIVDKQAEMQQDGILKRQAERAAQAQKDENRQRAVLLRSGLREQEQERQQANRLELNAERSKAAQANSILNTSLQQQMIGERAHQQRRSALIRAGLDATRSAYQSIGSGTSSVFSAMYAKMRSDTERGENQLTQANRQGLLRRKSQTELIMQQTTAEVRKQIGLYQQTQQQLDRGVVGAVAGTSSFGAGLRGLALGAGGAFGIAALTKEASGFEANLRVFAELNEEMKKSPALMEQMRQTAFNLGNDLALPGVSAADAADAMTALAKTGLTMENSIDSARGSLLLARVAGIDFSDSARTIGSTLNALGLEGNEAIKVVDGLSAALKLSGGASFDELRQGQQQALLVFKSTFKYTEEPIELMNQLNGSLALFSQNALRGSDAGTSLKTFLQSLQGKSNIQKGNILDVLQNIGEDGDFLFDAAGNARGFAESIDLVRRSFTALDPAQRTNMIQEIFGADAGRAAEIFISSTREELDALVNEVAASEGLTLRLAEAQNQGLMAGIDAFVSTIETIFIRLFAVVDKPLGKLIVSIGNAFGALADSKSFDLLRAALGGIVASLLAVGGAKAGIEVLRLLGLVLSAITSPLGLVVTGLAAVGGAIAVVLRASPVLRMVLGQLRDRFLEIGRTVSGGSLTKMGDIFTTIREKVEFVAASVGLVVALLADDQLRRNFIEWQNLPADSEKKGIFGFLLRSRDAVIGFIGTVRKTFTAVSTTIRRVATDPSFDMLRNALVGGAGGLAAVAASLKLVSAAKPALVVLRTAGTLLGVLVSPLGLAVAGIAGLAAGLTVLYRKSAPFRDVVDSLVDKLQDFGSAVLDAAGPAIDAFFDAVGGAAATATSALSTTLDTIVEFIGSSGFASALSTAGAIVGKVIGTIGDGLSKAVDFVQALVQTIEEVGVFEGLRQGLLTAFAGVAGFISEIFSTVGKTVGRIFDGINWAEVLATVAAGIFGFFATVGEAVGRFIGSKEFLLTLTVAVGTLATALGSAVSGLVVGLVDGLRGSDAGQAVGDFIKGLFTNITDALSGAGGAFANGLREALTSAVATALSAAFPPNLFYSLFTDPLGSALGAAVLVVEALFLGKIVKMFVGGFRTIQTTLSGLALAPKILSSGIGSVNAEVSAAVSASATNARAVERIGSQYGKVSGFAAKAADGMYRFSGAGKEVAAETKVATTNVDAQTAAIRANESAARGSVGAISANAEEQKKASGVLATLKDNYLGMAAAIGGGALAGFGIGTALTADNPLGVIGGITSAIAGIGTVASATAAVIASSGLTAGLLTGGVGLAVMAITAAVTYFTQRSNDAKAAANEVAEAAERYTAAFGGIINTTSGAQAATALEFFSRLNDTGSKEFAELRGAIKDFDLDLKESARAITGNADEYKKWAGEVQGQIDGNIAQIKLWRKEIDDLPDPGMGDSSMTPDQRAIQDDIYALEEKNQLLRDSLVTIQGARKAYEEALTVASEELLIRRNMKDLEDQRKAAQTLIIDQRREERNAVADLSSSLRDLIGLEDERRAKNSQLDFRQQARQVAESTVPTEGEPSKFNFGESAFGLTTAAADNATEAVNRLRDSFTETASEAATAASTAEAYLDALAAEQLKMIALFVEGGMSPEDAAILAEQVVAPFRDAEAVALGVIARISDELATLKQRMEGVNLGIVTDIQNTEAEKAVQAFVDDPSEKTISTLIDMGIPTETLEEFVKDPTEKSIKTIVDTVTFLDAAGKLAGFKAPVETPIKPVMDPVATAAALAARNAFGAPIEIPYIFVPGKKVTKKVFGFGPAQNQQVIVPAGNKYGSVIDRPTLTWVGEEKRKEVIIPLTMPERAAQLYRESGLGAVLAKGGISAPDAPAPQPVTVSAPASDGEVVAELRKLRSDMEEYSAARRDNIFQMQRPEDMRTARMILDEQRRRARRRRQ